MKTLLSLLVLSALSSSTVVVAQETLASYAAPTGVSYRSRSAAPPVSDSAAPKVTSEPIKSPGVSYATERTVSTSTTQTSPEKKMSLDTRTTTVREEKFSFDNLLEGVVYDFKKPNGRRLEFGGPGIGDWELTRIDEKYDIPFVMLLLLHSDF